MKTLIITTIMCILASAFAYAQDEITIISITINPEEVSVAAGEEVKFEATAYDADGNVQVVEVTWSLEGEIGAIDNDGELKTTVAGTGTVTAAYGEVTAQATVTVTEVEGDGEEIVPVEISPDTTTVEIGKTIEFKVTVKDSSGKKVENPEVAWSVDNTEIGTIDEIGVFSAVAAGEVTITVTSGEDSASAAVTVTEEPEGDDEGDVEVTPVEIFPNKADAEPESTVQFEVAVMDSAGNVIEDPEVIWSVDNTDLGTIDENGLFTAVADGKVTVTATVGEESAEARVTIAGPEERPEGVNTIALQRQLSNGKITKFGSAIFENNSITLGGIPHPFNFINGSKLFFQENSLSEDIVITIKLPTMAKIDNKNKSVEFEGDIINAVTFEVSVDGEVIHPYNFDEPLVLMLPYKRGLLDNLGIDPENLGMYYLDEDGTMSQEGITNVVVDSEANTITGNIPHFSDIAVAPKGSTTAVEEDAVPEAISLSQNVPNPFNPTTTIPFRISEASNVKLSIFNVIGQEIRSLENSYLNPGSYSIVWNGKDNAGNMVMSGVYFYRLRAGSHILTRKLMLLK